MKNIFIYCLIVLIYTGCTEMDETISWETKNIPTKAVVEGGIVTDTCFQLIRLSESGDYFLNEPTKKISNATITVSDGTQEFQFAESGTIPGWYYSIEKFAGEQGKIYSLDIELSKPVDNTSVLSAKDRLVQGFRIDSTLALLYKNPFYGIDDKEDSTAIILIVYGKQPNINDNYYAIQLYRNGQALYKNFDELTLYKNENSDDPEYSGMILFLPEDVVLYDTIAIDLIAISKDYYDYLRTIKEIVSPPDALGFSGPPADAKGNINNGSQLGFFRASQISRSTAVLKEPGDEFKSVSKP